MNQFPNQCRRKLKGIQCQNKHIQGFYFCTSCIEDVERVKKETKLTCNSEYYQDGERIKCKNERIKGGRKCYECIVRMENKNRYYPHRINKDLILDIKI